MSDKQQDVKIKYAWDWRRREYARWLVWRFQGIIRPVLRVLDWLSGGYSAEGYTDLELGEWLRIKWCGLHRRHVGHRVTLGGIRYCNFCQCRWDKKFR